MSKELIIGKNAGFCYGVKTAVEGTINELDNNNNNNNNNIYALGEIVHNLEVVNSLKEKGLVVTDDITEIKSKNKVILRAHGVSKQIYEISKKQNLEVKDLTCKKVLKIHKIADEYMNKGYYIVLVGSKNHPENIGTISYCGGNSLIMEDIDDIENIVKDIQDKKINNVLLIVQTTYSAIKFNEIQIKLKDMLDKLNIQLIIKNTICSATAVRQQETEDISKIVEAMIIIGGKNSSNTKKLYNIAKENTTTYLIETVKELNNKDFLNVNKIGIMAGASTPEKSIIEVKEFFEN